jgi:hypothetical protein
MIVHILNLQTNFILFYLSISSCYKYKYAFHLGEFLTIIRLNLYNKNFLITN